MKRFFLISTLLIAMFSTANAGDINGEWQCSKEFLDSFGLYYGQMKGHYKFKKNGTFTAKINGLKRTSRKFTIDNNNNMRNGGTKPVTTQWLKKLVNGTPTRNGDINYHAKHRRIYIKFKGAYDIVNDSISTTVQPEDVYCYIEPGRDRPDPPDGSESDYALRWKEFQQRLYDDEVFKSQVQAQTVKNEVIRLWIWDKEPVTVTKKTLTVGDKAMFTR